MVRFLGRCLPIICLPRKKRQSFPIGEQQTTGTKHQDEINKLFVRRVESIRVTHQGAVLKRIPLQTINERHREYKKTKSKSPPHNNTKSIKPDDTEFDCETHLSDRQSKQKNRIKSKKKSSSMKQKTKEKTPSPSRTPLEKLFHRTKKGQTLPPPSIVVNIPEDNHDDTNSSISSSSSVSSDWSTTTYPDSQSSDQSDNPLARRQSMPVSNLPHRNDEIKHRSCVESFYLGREHVRSSLSPSRTKTALPKIKEEQNQKKNSPPQQQQQQQNKHNEMKPSAKSKQVLQNVRKMIKDQSIQEQHLTNTRQRESVRL